LKFERLFETMNSAGNWQSAAVYRERLVSKSQVRRPACLFFVRFEGYTGGRLMSVAPDRLARSNRVKVAA